MTLPPSAVPLGMETSESLLAVQNELHRTAKKFAAWAGRVTTRD